MKTQSTEPAFSALSIFFLLIAMACAWISIVRGYESIWPMVEWIGGVSALALIASLVRDARK